VIYEVCPELEGEKEAPEEGRVKLAVAVVTNEKRQFGDPLQVKNVALEVLKNARGEPGHHCANLRDHPV
jgi:hypothetical protein